MDNKLPVMKIFFYLPIYTNSLKSRVLVQHGVNKPHIPNQRIILQIIFAHVPLINEVFETAPLNLQQWLFCLAVGSPMILWATVVNRFDPPN